MNRKKKAFAVVSCLLGTLIGIILLELGFRVLDFFKPFMGQYNLNDIAHFYSAHPFLNHTITPNLNCDIPKHININIPAYHLKTNALGFKFDLERFRSKETNRFRIAVLGDSLIEGYQEEFTLPSLLMRKLGTGLSKDRHIEVMNFGVGSYSTIIHFVNLKKNVLQFDPDLVILHFDMTDVFDDNHRYKKLTVWEKDGDPAAVHPSLAYSINIDGHTVSIFRLGKELSSLRPWYSPYRIRIWLIEHSYLFKFFNFQVYSHDDILKVYFRELESIYPKFSMMKNKNRSYSNILEWCVNYDHPRLQKEIRFSFGILDKIHSFLKSKKIPLLIITLPNRAQLKGKKEKALWSRHAIDKVRGFCRERSILFHVPLPEFEAALRDDKVIYFSDNMHPNNMGQTIWAESLAGYIKKKVMPRLQNKASE